MIDFDALWTSDKLANCREASRAEYAWLYGLADGHGCFEINPRTIHSRVSCIRPKLSIARITEHLAEFERNGLLFTWNGAKKYGFWVGSDKRGRLPPERERNKYKRSTPPVPVAALREYESRFARDAIGTESPQGSGLGSGLGFDLERNGSGVGLEEVDAHSNCDPQTVSQIPLRETNPPKAKPKKVNQYGYPYAKQDDDPPSAAPKTNQPKMRKVDRWGMTLAKQDDEEEVTPNVSTPADELRRTQAEIDLFSEALKDEKSKFRPNHKNIKNYTEIIERNRQKIRELSGLETVQESLHGEKKCSEKIRN